MVWSRPLAARARSLATTVGAAVALALVSCGSADYTYVKNADDQTYFKVPVSWSRVDQKSLDAVASGGEPDSAAARVADLLSWTIAYDASAVPSTAHIFGAESDRPVVYANVRSLTEQERNHISLDAMRDALLPVTEEARQRAAQTLPQLGSFELLLDRVVRPASGVRGVRTVFNYRVGSAQLQTFDETVLVNDDNSKLYLFLVRCSARCYLDRQEELRAVISSFTVRN